MVIIGHRGARGLAPENTLASFRKALEHGVDELEFDLRVTKDNIVILHHDPFLTDPDGQKHTIAEFTYKELLAHKTDLVTFEEFLDEIGHPVRLYIEVKPDELVKPIVASIKARLQKGWNPEHFLLASFSQPTLLELHKALPDIEKAVLERWSGVRATRRARQLSATRIVMNQKWLWSGFIRAKRRSGYQLCAYTLNDPAKAKRWEKHGLYGVVTDFPDRFQK